MWLEDEQTENGREGGKKKCLVLYRHHIVNNDGQTNGWMDIRGKAPEMKHAENTS